MSDATLDTSSTTDYDPAAIEARWRESWRRENAFLTPEPREGTADAYVLASFPLLSEKTHLDHVHSYSICDAHARYRRARGDAVLFSLGFEAFGLPAEIDALDRGLQPREWVDRCIAAMRERFDRMGFSVDWSRAFASCDEDVYRWSQWLFLALLDAGLVVEREGSVAWCEQCATTLARSQVHDGRCWQCNRVVALTRRPQWFLRTSAYDEENDRRLEGIPGWNEHAVERQRGALGRVDGVEVVATALDGRTLTLFTPFADAVTAAEFALLSPNYPDIDRWTGDPEIRERLGELRDGGWRHDERKLDQVEILETGLSVVAAELAAPLPVLVSPVVDARFGPTAVLGIPAADATDRAIAQRLEGSPMFSWRSRDSHLATRPAARFRAPDVPVSRPRAWGAPIPIVRCDACGAVPVPVDQLPVRLPGDLLVTSDGNALEARADFTRCDCPACGKPARRETDTLDFLFGAAWHELVPAVPREDRSRALLEHPELERWLPAARSVHGDDAGDIVLGQRTVAKMLRDSGPLDFLADGEPHGPTLWHEAVREHPKMTRKQLRHAIDPATIVDRVGADALRFAVLYAAAPARSFVWDETVLALSAAFLRRVWAFGEPRLRASSAPIDVRIDMTDSLRRRLASWCDTAARRITENLELLDMHRATRNLIMLFTRIEDFEERVVARDGDFPAHDREAVVVALRLFVRLLAPVAPHLAEELWSRSGGGGFVADAGWPA